MPYFVDHYDFMMYLANRMKNARHCESQSHLVLPLFKQFLPLVVAKQQLRSYELVNIDVFLRNLVLKTS